MMLFVLKFLFGWKNVWLINHVTMRFASEVLCLYATDLIELKSGEATSRGAVGEVKEG